MKTLRWNVLLTAAILASMSIVLTGCGGSSAPVPSTPAANTDGGHNLDGWWCSEHGVPEAECSLCSEKAAADFKAKGDWCKEHNRAESQCFICHPEYEAKFAARYEAKTGKKPPKPTE